MNISNYIKNKTTYETRLKIRYKLRSIKALFYRANLDKLASINKTYKNRYHFYTQHYQNHFKPYRYKKINLLEIGVGGYENPLSGGESLRMWKSFFPFAKIFSLDIFDKSFLQEKRKKITAHTSAWANVAIRCVFPRSSNARASLEWTFETSVEITAEASQ